MSSLDQCLARMSIRQLAMWSMVVLDPCCHELARAQASKPLADDTIVPFPRWWNRARIDAQYDDLMTATLDLTRSILSDVCQGRNLTGVYPRIGKVVGIAYALDGLRLPLRQLSSALYGFFTIYDLLWTCWWDFDRGALRERSVAAEEASVYLNQLAEIPAATAEAVPDAQHPVTLTAEEAALWLLQQNGRDDADLLGAELPNQVIQWAHANLRFLELPRQ